MSKMSKGIVCIIISCHNVLDCYWFSMQQFLHMRCNRVGVQFAAVQFPRFCNWIAIYCNQTPPLHTHQSGVLKLVLLALSFSTVCSADQMYSQCFEQKEVHIEFLILHLICY